jgi:hypothetical protein
MNVSENVSWAAGELAEHPGRLALITTVGLLVFGVIMLQGMTMPWAHGTPAPTINNTTIIREPGKPDRVVVRTSVPRPAAPGPVETTRRQTRSVAPSQAWTRAPVTPQPRPRPVPDATPAPRPSATSPRPTVSSSSSSSATVTSEPTVAPTVDPTPERPVTSPEGTTTP